MKKDTKNLYKEKIIPSLMEEYGYKNVQLVPKLLKISINRGLGEEARSSKEIDTNLKELAVIAGQQPTVNKARKSIAGFKIRDGMPVGASVTLRQDRMYAFLERLIHITLPRVRDFRGISAEGFDGRGNYNLGIKDQLIFPEISYDDVNQLQGFDISIVTSANTDEEAYSLLKKFGMPLQARA
nr:ribosomal protein L5 [Emiliania huxleyi]UQM89609.1 ribosomal protein L5 [Emiliania huxleyi]WJW65122.1 ribosomal protein L5 [Emiliania huxleyi]